MGLGVWGIVWGKAQQKKEAEQLAAGTTTVRENAVSSGLTVTAKVGIGIAVLVGIFFILSMMGMFEDPNFDYCFDRFYDQGFRGDDLQVLLEACLENPGR